MHKMNAQSDLLIELPELFWEILDDYGAGWSLCQQGRPPCQMVLLIYSLSPNTDTLPGLSLVPARLHFLGVKKKGKHAEVKYGEVIEIKKK